MIVISHSETGHLFCKKVPQRDRAQILRHRSHMQTAAVHRILQFPQGHASLCCHREIILIYFTNFIPILKIQAHTLLSLMSSPHRQPLSFRLP